MNHYPHHIGDFNNATRHLTRVERALYRDMLDLYYDKETPLPTDVQRLARLLIANSDEEKAAIQVVLDDFFTLEDDGYHNKRCDEEISAYRAKIAQASRAGQASAQRRSSGRNANAQHEDNGGSTPVERPLNGRTTNQNQNQNQNQLSSSPDFKSEDDEYFASLAEQEQKRQAEADARVKVEMTPDWQPDLKVLDDHLKFLGIKVLVNGKAVTSADLTAEITSDFRSAGHRKQERRTNHDWHGGLANYLIARIKNPKPETPRNVLPGGQNDTSKPHPLAFSEENRPERGPYALFKPGPKKTPMTDEGRARVEQLRRQAFGDTA